MGDLLDPPAGRAEGEHVADPGLVDHLLVELADPPARRVPPGGVALADQEDAEQAAVGDGAAGGDGQPLRSGPGGQQPGVALPDQPRPQLGEVLATDNGRCSMSSTASNALRGRSRKLLGPADQGVQLVGLGLLDRDHGHDLLGQHVQRVAQLGDLLDGALPHPLDHHRRLDQVAAMVGEEDPAGGRADLVPGPADPLQPAGHRRRGLDLDHDVDRAHVDAELERGGGDHARQPARLQVGLDLGPLLLADRAVVRPGDDRRRRCRRGPAEAPDWAITSAGGGNSLGAARPSRSACSSLRCAVSRSASRRELAKTMVERCALIRSRIWFSTCGQIDGGRGGGLLVVQVAAGRGRRRSPPRSLMSSTGTTIDRSQDFSAGGRDDPTGCGPPRKRRPAPAAGPSPRARSAGSGRRRRRPAARLGGQRLQPLQGERQVGAALGAGQRVHLVDDHRPHGAQHVAGRRGQHQEQRLRRGDQDVRRPGGDGPAVGGRGVAGPDADGDVRRRLAEPQRGLGDAGERGPQVALDVDGQRLERRDVEHPAALAWPAAGRTGSGRPAPRGRRPGSCRIRSER